MLNICLILIVNFGPYVQKCIFICIAVDQPALYWEGSVADELGRTWLSAPPTSADSLFLSSGVLQVHPAPSYKVQQVQIFL